ncbi:hypothetical protein [Deinococcus hopiensis]|uniref:Uncharacterized protein n=1 Tax=Deinococcus hopiensis KR-140 TaxID=695939 RepID=A0A1W1UBH5_9DEIO|nr:hypothetical protein [Deinococcus hopiensis]SMB78390.1 hypothetical protein SAMN00790413_06635 [Deinococcus hopiensis KR-140]
MRMNHRTLTALFAATLLTSSVLAAPTAAKTAASTAQGQLQDRGPQAQAMQVTYYAGHPLQGGKRLSSATVTPQRGSTPFANAPKGATYAVMTTPFGKRIVNLKNAQAQQPRDDRGGPPGPDGAPPQSGQNGRERNGGGAPTGQAPADRPAPGQDRGPRGGPDGMYRGATSVTYYNADPLNGGKVLKTVKLTNTTTAPQAPSGAKYAVIDRGGDQEVVNLTALPSAPQG